MPYFFLFSTTTLCVHFGKSTFINNVELPILGLVNLRFINKILNETPIFTCGINIKLNVVDDIELPALGYIKYLRLVMVKVVIFICYSYGYLFSLLKFRVYIMLTVLLYISRYLGIAHSVLLILIFIFCVLHKEVRLGQLIKHLEKRLLFIKQQPIGVNYYKVKFARFYRSIFKSRNFNCPTLKLEYKLMKNVIGYLLLSLFTIQSLYYVIVLIFIIRLGLFGMVYYVGRKAFQKCEPFVNVGVFILSEFIFVINFIIV